MSDRGSFHKYVERFVRAAEAEPGGMDTIHVKKWYAKALGMPDSAWNGTGKTRGYHLGHLRAFWLPDGLLRWVEKN